MKEQIFLSLDIEANGPSPTTNDCLQIAVAACTYHEAPSNYNRDEWLVSTLDLCFLPQENRKEDEQTMNEFWSKYPEILDKIRQNAKDPTENMNRLVAWLKMLENDYEIVEWVAAPAGYDWQWLNCMYNSYPPTEKYNLPHSCKCLSSMKKIIRNWPTFSDIDGFLNVGCEKFPHTHYAVDDAVEQAYKYLRLTNFSKSPYKYMKLEFL